MDKAITDAADNVRQDLVEIQAQIDLLTKLLVRMTMKQMKLQDTLNLLESQASLQMPARPYLA